MIGRPADSAAPTTDPETLGQPSQAALHAAELLDADEADPTIAGRPASSDSPTGLDEGTASGPGAEPPR